MNNLNYNLQEIIFSYLNFINQTKLVKSELTNPYFAINIIDNIYKTFTFIDKNEHAINSTFCDFDTCNICNIVKSNDYNITLCNHNSNPQNNIGEPFGVCDTCFKDDMLVGKCSDCNIQIFKMNCNYQCKNTFNIFNICGACTK
jgi:hypothetical protein